MRPRQACLGIFACRVQAKTGRQSFNEAEASLPRNLICSLMLILSARCFNEAEASLPRNPIDEVVFEFSGEVASMRPRQACLGIPV